MSKTVQSLHGYWQQLFTLPADGPNLRLRRTIFVYLWLWAVAGAIPGALLAAYIIGQFRIADQKLQDVVSTGLAFLSLLLIQVGIIVLLDWSTRPVLKLTGIEKQLPGGTATASENLRIYNLIALLVWPLLVVFIEMVVPFALAAGAIYWYFTHGPAALNVGARGTAGALALKVLLTLINVIVWPAIKAIALKGFWQWLRGGGVTTSKP